jgi:hypothetical protein
MGRINSANIFAALIAACLMLRQGTAASASLDLLDKFTSEEAHTPAERNYDTPFSADSLNGFAYRRYSDGSASFQTEGGDWPSVLDASRKVSWDVRCDIDAMDDTRLCSVVQGPLQVVLDKNCRALVAVGSDHFPRSESLVRIAQKKPFVTADASGMFSAAASAQIVSALRDGSLITTRYMEWPYRSWKDDQIKSQAFKEAAQYACWAIKRIHR